MNIIETRRLFLRPFLPADVHELYKVTSDPRVMATVGNGQAYSAEQTRKFIEQTLKRYHAHGYGVWAACDREHGRVIGWAGFIPMLRSSEAEIVFAFSFDYWAHGLATEVSRPLLAHGFERLGFKRVWATIDPANEASVRTVKKLGMKFVKMENDENGLPTEFYMIAREEWSGV